MGALTAPRLKPASLGDCWRGFHWRGACSSRFGVNPATAFHRCNRALGKARTWRGLRNDERRSSHQRAERSDVPVQLGSNSFHPLAFRQGVAAGPGEHRCACGRCYVPRSAFAAYLEHVFVEATQSATTVSLRHRRTRVVGLGRENGAFRVELANGGSLQVDRVAICTGHVPSAPCRVREGAARHPRVIANPWAPDSLSAVRRSDRVLIVGTGLTMVDVVTTLARAYHQGPIVAISQRGLLPLEHGQFANCDELFEGVRPATALELLRLVRAEVRQRDGELDWQAIVDALRRRLPEVWAALPAPERIRAVRRLMPFWEVHRFRIAPQGAAAVARLKAQGALTVQRARAIEVDAHEESLLARLRLPGGAIVERTFDSIIMCSGASRNIRDNASARQI